MTLHNAHGVPGPLATTGGAIATLTACVLAILVLIGVLVALAHRYTVCRCGQAEEDA